MPTTATIAASVSSAFLRLGLPGFSGGTFCTSSMVCFSIRCSVGRNRGVLGDAAAERAVQRDPRVQHARGEVHAEAALGQHRAFGAEDVQESAEAGAIAL